MQYDAALFARPGGACRRSEGATHFGIRRSYLRLVQGREQTRLLGRGRSMVLRGSLLPVAADLVVVRRENRSAHSSSRCSSGRHLCDKHFSQIMRLTIAVFVFLIVGRISCIYAERSNSTAETSDAATRKLVINPSSTSVALGGKANLIVSPLTHRNGNYVGDYQLKVRSYFLRARKAVYSWRHPMMRFGSSRREQRSTLPVRP